MGYKIEKSVYILFMVRPLEQLVSFQLQQWTTTTASSSLMLSPSFNSGVELMDRRSF